MVLFFSPSASFIYFVALLSSCPNCVVVVGAGLFNDIDHHQVVAIASCFLPVEKSNEQVRLKDELAWPLEKLKETAKQLAEVCLSC
jgi:superfamily II RNA helicase